jgi:NADH:ubiquinone oxidoreductase subunit 3 (subunit A)
MENWLLSPPVIFAVILVLLFMLNRLFKRLAFHSDKSKPGCSKPYACGENNFDNNAQPDYSLFFPFAFFFTLAHVTTLMITTIPLINAGALVVAMLYVIGGIIGLYVLLRK